MRGPKSFQAAGEISDGCHHALSYTREAYDFAVENIRIGAERAGKDPDSLDIGAWVVFATGPDAAKAKDAARAMVGIYASSMPAEQLQRNGVDPAELSPIIDAIAGGDLAKGIELTSPELADRLSVSGSPAECAAKIRDEIAPSGVNHMVLAITDRSLVKAFTGHGHRRCRRRQHSIAADPRRSDPGRLRPPAYRTTGRTTRRPPVEPLSMIRCADDHPASRAA